MGSGVVGARQSIVVWKGRVRSGGLGATSVSGFSTAVSTNARNDATILLLNHPNPHVPHLMSHTVLVRRVPLHRLPPLRDLSIHSRHIHSAQSASPLAPPHVRNPPRCSHLCQAKCHSGPCPPCTIEITRPCRVEEPRAVFPATKSTTAVLVITRQKRARSSAIAHARFSAPVVDINVLGCVVPAFSRYSVQGKETGWARGGRWGWDWDWGRARGIARLRVDLREYVVLLEPLVGRGGL